MDKNNKTLAEQILDGDTSNLEARLKAAPYSQPLQRLAEEQGLPNHSAILSYNRHKLAEAEDSIEGAGTVDIISTDSPDTETVKHREEKKPKGTAKGKRRKGKKSKSRATKGGTDFSHWLMTMEQLPGGVVEVKRSKKKKKRKKKSKTILDKNIQSSIQAKEEIASEALAKLYAAQGHHKKALKMYEKLSLINPQKSSFFAPLIENLKNKLQ